MVVGVMVVGAVVVGVVVVGVVVGVVVVGVGVVVVVVVVVVVLVWADRWLLPPSGRVDKSILSLSPEQLLWDPETVGAHS